MDLIDRQAAMAFPLSWDHRDNEHGSDEFISGVECYRDYIGGLPSAQQWIPVSERLPQYDGEKYLVTYYAEKIGRTRIGISYCYANREGFWSDIPLGYKVVAWCELPELYKGEES